MDHERFPRSECSTRRGQVSHPGTGINLPRNLHDRSGTPGIPRVSRNCSELFRRLEAAAAGGGGGRAGKRPTAAAPSSAAGLPAHDPSKTDPSSFELLPPSLSRRVRSCRVRMGASPGRRGRGIPTTLGFRGGDSLPSPTRARAENARD